jgi:hypothetical protein
MKTASPSAAEGLPDVPAQVFEGFLAALTEAGVSAEVVVRLRKTLLEDKAFTDRTLREAVFGEGALP